MASSGSGGPGGGAELSPPPPPPPICCMCGDHGLMQEMFQCKVCVVRSQHKYCSELYLKTESHRACNWCLREYSNSNEGSTKLRDAKKSSLSSNTASTATAAATATASAASSGGAVKIHREAFPSQLNSKPVKKLRVLQSLDPSASSDVSDRMRSEQELLKGRQPQQVGKAKVRRYKLLEEVSS